MGSSSDLFRRTRVSQLASVASLVLVERFHGSDGVGGDSSALVDWIGFGSGRARERSPARLTSIGP